MMKLINRTNRMKVIPLPHHSYCKALGRCVCIQLAGMKGKVATSLTIPAGGTSKELPDAVLKVPQVERMIKRHQLEVAGENTTLDNAPSAGVKKKPRKRRKGSSSTSKTKPPVSPKTQE
jgi:hypothetical protein